MRTVRVLLVLGLTLLSYRADAGCQLPPPPSRIPNGATATDQEMQTAMSVMSQYETDVNNYLKCVRFEATQERISDAEMTRLTSEALTRHQSTVMLFNAQMRLYMAR